MDFKSDQDKLLELATYWKQRRPYKIPCVGDIIKGYVSGSIRPKKRQSPVIEAWKKVIPPAFEDACRIESFKGGVLKVAVSEPSYKFQMEMLKRELIQSLQEQIKGSAKLKDIKFV